MNKRSAKSCFWSEKSHQNFPISNLSVGENTQQNRSSPAALLFLNQSLEKVKREQKNKLGKILNQLEEPSFQKIDTIFISFHIKRWRRSFPFIQCKLTILFFIFMSCSDQIILWEMEIILRLFNKATSNQPQNSLELVKVRFVFDLSGRAQVEGKSSKSIISSSRQLYEVSVELWAHSSIVLFSSSPCLSLSSLTLMI
jgi:hypothetical protein